MSVPTVNTSSWRLPKRGSTNSDGIPSDAAYARVGLGMIPREAAQKATPGPVSEGAPPPTSVPRVDTSAWRLPQPAPKPASEQTLVERQRTLAGLLPEGEKRFGLGLPQKQMPSEAVVPRQVEAREPEVSYRPEASAVSPISEDLRRLIGVAPRLPTPVNDSRGIQRPVGQGLLDETASGGQAFIDQVLRDSLWDMRRPGFAKTEAVDRADAEKFIFKKFPPDSKMKTGGKLKVMLTGTTAKHLGVKDHTTVVLGDLDDATLAKLAALLKYPKSEAAPPVHKGSWSGSEPSYVDSAAQMKAAQDAKAAKDKAAKDAKASPDDDDEDEEDDEFEESLDEIVGRRIAKRHDNPAGHGAPVRQKRQTSASKQYNKSPAAKRAKREYERTPGARTARRRAARYRESDDAVIETLGSALRRLGDKIKGAGGKIVDKSKPSAKASIQSLKKKVGDFKKRAMKKKSEDLEESVAPGSVSHFLTILTSKLTQSDQRQNQNDIKKGRSGNIYRLGHYLGAVEKIRTDMKGREASTEKADLEALKASINKRFIVSDMPPAKFVVKGIDTFLAGGKPPKLSGAAGTKGPWSED